MFRKPAIWIIFILLSFGGAIFSFQYFPKVFPIIELDLQMDRKSALDSARLIAKKHSLGPNGYRQSASFEGDSKVKYYIELEVGGSNTFQNMIREGLYSPYIWNVRHFKEGEVNESEIRFTPDGQPYGFSEWLSEDQSGASLSPEEAQKIAESEAKNSWNVDLEEYSLIEKSQESRPGGRIDHTFTYERPDHKIGEGRYRLRLEISGDKLTELYHYIKIPQEFSLRYKEMRSANDTIANVAFFIMFLIFVLGGCCFGLFYLMRKRWVIWRAPLFWGSFIALLQALTAVNEWPGEWMYYDTALSTQVFMLEKVADLTTEFLFSLFLITISIMAAESLTRKAFPGHIQLWRLSAPKVANSIQVFGRTISGYMLISLDFTFLIGLYFFCTKILGWWTPSDVLFDPNILATYFPWFSPLADSLQAGFWEECLCRAVPIAGAALIGQKLGHRKLWITGAIIFQAIVFGSLHANYVGQPSYSRVIELIIPSLVYGWIYLRFGLLPSIILHFVYDAVLMALPLFVSSAAGIWIDQIIVIALVFVPLWIAIIRRLQNGKWSELESKYYNKAWQPPIDKKIELATDNISDSSIISSKKLIWISVGGIVGLVIWVFTTNFHYVSPPLLIDRNQAQSLAKNALKDNGIELSSSWQISSAVRTPDGKDDLFVWEQGGEDVYRRLMGNYLNPPLWMIRFAKFEGDVTERAEQYYVYIYGDGKISHIQHKLPESREGAFLNEDLAREIAYSAVRSKYHLDPTLMEEVAAESSSLASRLDWTFIFSDQNNYPLKIGEARIGIVIAGDEVVNTIRYVHVPENPLREYEKRKTLSEIVHDFRYSLMLSLAIVLVTAAMINWSRKQFSVKIFFLFVSILFSINIIHFTNNWPAMVAGFSIAEPIINQIITEITSSVFTLVFLPITFSLFVGFVQIWKRSQTDISIVKALLVGVSFGIMFTGISSLLTHLISPTEGIWADYTAADSYLPILDAGLEPLKLFILKTIVYLLLFTSLDKFTKGWTFRKVQAACILIIFWSAFTAYYYYDDDILLWLLTAIIHGILLLYFYVSVFRFHLAIIPFATASMIILNVLKKCTYNAYPGAILGAILTIMLIGLFSYYWHRKLSVNIRNQTLMTKSIFIRPMKSCDQQLIKPSQIIPSN